MSRQRYGGSTPSGAGLEVAEQLSGAVLQGRPAHRPGKRVRDVSEKERIQSVLVRTEGKLLEPRKVEGVGRLKGGVVHDFNNLLTAIIGYTTILLSRPGLEREALHLLSEISAAASRATDLARQLLASGRTRALQPGIISLNEQVLENKRMLDPLIGENIHIKTDLDPADGRVLADAGRLGQVIADLVLNARDAMPQGGTIAVETRCLTLGEAYRKEHAEMQAGRYVLLSVRDTGHGMSTSVQAHLFEPYFTTKKPGQGHGLGLSTAYAFVKQCGGHIYVCSEEGKGTAFTIYLPRTESTLSPAAEATTDVVPCGREEVIVLAEDDEPVRRLCAKVLRGCRYTVIEAPNGRSALDVASGADSRVDLLITDVIMPEMSGRELAQRFERRFAGLRVLYISGYTENVVPHGSMPSQEACFLRKPFSPQTLAIKVREVLDREG